METIPKTVTEWVMEAYGNNSETSPTEVNPSAQKGSATQDNSSAQKVSATQENSSAQKVSATQENSSAQKPRQNKRMTRPMSLLVSNSEFDQKIKKIEIRTEKKISIELKSINNLIELSEANEFPDRKFYIEEDEKIMSYTPILHFFESESVFKTNRDFKEYRNFFCKFCGVLLEANFPKFTNFYSHLLIKCKKSKPIYSRWKFLYDRRKEKKNLITKEKLVLINFLCSANIPLTIIKNPFFQIMCFNFLGQIPSHHNVRYILIPQVIYILS